MKENYCIVCEEPLNNLIYQSSGSDSLTSLCEVSATDTSVYFCKNCGHIQTSEIKNIDEYYDTQYKILIDSEEEQQLYEIKNGNRIYRFDHQAITFVNKLKIPQNSKILDYGSAKASTLKKIKEIRPDIEPFVFDVSEMYRPFWNKFIKPENCAFYKTKKEWKNSFDIITSFFVLEHAKNVREALRDVYNLLKPEGVFYFIVPNTLVNIADLIVIDHINHFTINSITHLMNKEGFYNIDIDTNSHAGAFIVSAKKDKDIKQIKLEEIKELEIKVKEISDFWNNIKRRVLFFEKEYSNHDKSAIYGSGFYGSFLASSLKDLNKVSCFIDANPFRQGKTLFNKPIISPESLDKGINLIYVGLNPKNAKKEIEKVEGWKIRNNIYFFP